MNVRGNLLGMSTGVLLLAGAGVLGFRLIAGGPDAATASFQAPEPQASAFDTMTVHPTINRRVITTSQAKSAAKPAATPAPTPATAGAATTIVRADDALDGFDDEPAASPPSNSGAKLVVADDDFDMGFDDAFDDGFGEEEPVGEDDKPRLTTAMVDAMKTLPGGLAALPEAPNPADNPTTDEKIELGRLLYFDKRLSGDGSMSCATCHHPDHGYSDAQPLAIGFGGKVLGRHSPTVLNAAYNTKQFWDGRADTLEQQAAGPIMASVEMNMGSTDELITRLNADPDYPRMFQAVFGEEPSLENVAKAIATFERTIVTPNSRFDLYAAGDKAALTEQEKRGLILFFGKASCTNCHSGPNFTDDQYHNLGLIAERGEGVDGGRFAVTQSEEDFGAFRTPTVRNAELTAPYMHDGSVSTLEELVEFYDRGGHDGVNKSELLQPLKLTDQEKADLVAFMKSLTGTPPKVTDPWADRAGLAGVETDTE